MPKFKKIFLGCVVIFTLGIAHADVNVGVILSLTGPAASLGIPAQQTVEMWPTTIGNQKLNVTVLDDASDPTAATLAARKLVTKNNVDILIGPSITATALAVLEVAGETKTPMITLSGGGAVINPQEGPKKWAYKLPPSEEIQLNVIFNRMKKRGEKTLTIIAAKDGYGQVFIEEANKLAPTVGIDIVSIERFASNDTSFVSQALKIMSKKPDAVFIAASGTPAALPQLELKKIGYGGTQYQTQAVANNDYLRVGGKAIEGTFMSVSPILVAEQLPENNIVKPVAVNYVEKVKAKYGIDALSLFGGTAWDAHLLLSHIVPLAMKSAAPGTPEFRLALRDTLENNIKNLVLAEGVYTMSHTNHNGADERSQVLVEVKNGKWKFVD